MIDRSASAAARRCCLAAALVGLGVLAPTGVPRALGEEIRIGGTGNALATLRLLGDAYTRQHPDVTIDVLASLGSSGAFKAVAKGAIDIGVASRAANDGERAAGIVSSEYARSLTVLAVPNRVAISAVTRAQIADIYSGKLRQWPDGTAIRPLLRQLGDDNTRQLMSLSPAIEQALRGAEQRQDLAFAVTDQEAADKLESIAGAFGVSTLALIAAERRALKPLSLDGVDATLKNGASGAYPLIKRFYFATRSARPASVRQFMAFVASREGRKILASNGQWTPSAAAGAQ